MKKYLLIKSKDRTVISESDDLEELEYQLRMLIIPFNEYYYVIDSKDLNEERFSCYYSRMDQFYKNKDIIKNNKK